jgi:hypothetical protein
MGDNDEETKCPYPGIDPAFDWVKGIIRDQRQLAEIYFNRLLTLFSVATAIVGIGLPFGAKLLEDSLRPWTGSFIAFVLAVLAYLIIVVLTVIGLWMRKYESLDDPVMIREQFWCLTPGSSRSRFSGT